MICSKCGSDNVDWGAYCKNCGAALGSVCHCSFVNQSGDHYCGGCGRPLLKNDATGDEADLSAEISPPPGYQYSKIEIQKLIQESIYFKIDNRNDLDQSDIDNIFNVTH